VENQIKPTCAYVDAHLLCLTDEVAQKAPHKGAPPSGKKEENTVRGFFCGRAQKAKAAAVSDKRAAVDAQLRCGVCRPPP